MILFQFRSSQAMPYVTIEDLTKVCHPSPFRTFERGYIWGEAHPAIFEIHSRSVTEGSSLFGICCPCDRFSSRQYFVIELLVDPILQTRYTVLVSGRLLQLSKNFIEFIINFRNVLEFMFRRSDEIAKVLIWSKICISDESRDWHFVVDFTKELVITIRVFFLHCREVRWCSGEAKNNRIIEKFL